MTTSAYRSFKWSAILAATLAVAVFIVIAGVLRGTKQESRASASVSTPTMTGDLDGGVVPDILIADPSAAPTPASGQVGVLTIVSGETGAVATTITGTAPDGEFGAAASVIGDLNGDGFNDIAVGAPGVTGTASGGEGAIYVFFGPFPAGAGDERTAADADLFMEAPVASTYGFGDHIAPLADFDMDGIVDLRVRGWYLDGQGQPNTRTYVVSGSTGVILHVVVGNDPFDPWADQPGDVNGDGEVSEADLSIIQANLGMEGDLPVSDGDLNADGVVDGADYQIALDHQGESVFYVDLEPADLHWLQNAQGISTMLPRNIFFPWIGGLDIGGGGAGGGGTGGWGGGGSGGGGGGGGGSGGGGGTGGGIGGGGGGEEPPPCDLVIRQPGFGGHRLLPPKYVAKGSEHVVGSFWGYSAVASSWTTSTTMAEIIEPPDPSNTHEVRIRFNDTGFARVTASINDCEARWDVWVVDVKVEVPNDVILVNSLNTDGDVLPGYVDGFNHLGPAHTLDDESAGTAFMPVEVRIVGLLEAGGASVSITYSASDPLDIQATLDDPFVLAPGTARLWLKDGAGPRDPRPVLEGGDFVAPGQYAASDLCLTGNSASTTLFLEAIRETSVDGLSIRVEVQPEEDPRKGIVSGQGSLTAARVELLGRGKNDQEFFEVGGLVGTTLADPNDPPLPPGFLPGAWMTFKVNVYDARQDGIDEITLDGQSLPLIPGGSFYETPEFMCLPIDTPEGAEIPPYPIVWLDDALVAAQYNPTWTWHAISRLDDPAASDTLLAGIIKDVTEEMKNEGWVPDNPLDDGAFGKEVHRRVSVRLQGQSRWLADVYVDSTTFEVLSIGAYPPGRPTSTVTQIDLLYLKSGYNPLPGEVLDHTRIDRLHEIKTSIDGAISSDQKRRLKEVMRGGPIHISQSDWRWSQSAGWHRNAKFSNVGKLLSIVGAAFVVYNFVRPEGVEWQLDEALRLFNSAARQTSEVEKKVDAVLGLLAFQQYFANFMIDDTALTAVTLHRIYKILDDDWMY